jgi:predicted ABC-type ATPase
MLSKAFIAKYSDGDQLVSEYADLYGENKTIDEGIDLYLTAVNAELAKHSHTTPEKKTKLKRIRKAMAEAGAKAGVKRAIRKTKPAPKASDPTPDEPITTCPPVDKKGKPRIDPAAIAHLDEVCSSLPQTIEKHMVKGKLTTRRKRLHDRIIKEQLKHKPCQVTEPPIAVLTGGAPGSGKSHFLKKYAPWLTSKDIFHIDADAIRAKFPEYKGWNASATHKESQIIVNQLLDTMGKPCTTDIVYDGTMNKAEKYIPIIEKLKKMGYKVYIVYMQVPKEVSQQRVRERYVRSGRYVPSIVIDEVYDRGLDAYEALLKSVDGYVRVDGVTNEIIEKGGEEIPTTRTYKSGIRVSANLKDVEQVDTVLFDEKFDKDAKTLGIELALYEKEHANKIKATNKRHSAPERAQAQKRIRDWVKELDNGTGDMDTLQLIKLGQKINSERSMYSQFVDLGGTNKKVLYPTKKNVEMWAKNPGRYDLLGVDAAKATKSTAGELKGTELLFFMM